MTRTRLLASGVVLLAIVSLVGRPSARPAPSWSPSTHGLVDGRAPSGDGAADGALTLAAGALALGRTAYLRECAACHGAHGEGAPDWQVPLTDGSLPAPPHDSSGHTWHHPDDELLRIVAEGGAIYSPVSRMPPYADRLSRQEMAAVLAYIKTFWGARERTYQEERTADEAYMRRQTAPTAAP